MGLVHGRVGRKSRLMKHRATCTSHYRASLAHTRHNSFLSVPQNKRPQPPAALTHSHGAPCCFRSLVLLVRAKTTHSLVYPPFPHIPPDCIRLRPFQAVDRLLRVFTFNDDRPGRQDETQPLFISTSQRPLHQLPGNAG